MKSLNIILPFLLSIVIMGCAKHKKRVFPVDGFAVAGVAKYEKKTPTITFVNRISLKNELAPISCAVVHVIDTATGDIIAEGETRSDGAFIIGLPEDKQNASLVVRVLSVSSIELFPMMVIDQDSSGKTYFLQSDVFTGTTNDMEIIATHDGENIAGVFNIFSQIMRGYKFMVEKGGEGKTKFPALEVRWQENEVGIDCTCFFPRFLQPAVINLREDENDDSVILHEFGHYLQESFSYSSSPGGLHIIACNQNDDPRLTWSEGWATGFSLIVRKSPYYIDTDNQNFFLDHESPCHVGQGPTSETLVAAVYYDLFDGKNELLSKDPDTLSISFLQIWSAMKKVKFSFKLTMYDYFIALTNSGAVTKQQWLDNFSSLGFDETTMIANSSPTSNPTAAPHTPPQATPEFHAILETND